jgi:hypothetical protein
MNMQRLNESPLLTGGSKWEQNLFDLRLPTIRRCVKLIKHLRCHNEDLDLLWTFGRVHNVLDLFRAGEACTRGTAERSTTPLTVAPVYMLRCPPDLVAPAGWVSRC